MKNNIYVFGDSSRRVDSTKAKAYTLSAMAKSPALNELMKFIFDGCHGLIPEISEKTIDDAFDCILDNRKATLYARDLSDNERERIIREAEADSNLRKETFKSWLRVKE